MNRAKPRRCGGFYPCLALVLSLLCVHPLGARGLAQTPGFWNYQIDLGAPAASGSAAIGSLKGRLDAVTTWNACGRELEFLAFTRAHDIGEGLLSAVIGKMRWLQTHGSNETCVQEVFFPQDDLVKALSVVPGSWSGKGGVALDVLNEGFRSTFDSASQPFGVEDFDRYCEPTVHAPAQPADPKTGYKLLFKVSAWCLRRELNVALAQEVELKHLGTTGLPCGLETDEDSLVPSLGKAGEGEWDVVVRDVVRVLYLDRRSSHPLLDPETHDHLLHDLATVSGPLEPESYSLYECGNQESDTGSPQERADERDWYEKGLFADLGDLLDWLWNRIVIVAAVAGLILLGFVVPGLGWLVGAGAVVLVGGGASGLLRIPESENHLFMINTSRYLINRLIIEALTDDADRKLFEKDNEGVKEWLLDRLQRVASEDFREYNARPYQRYTIMALMNLYDFAGDAELKTGSAIVLDFAAAKFAAGSNQARRVVPFRRLMEVIPGDFYASPPRRMFEMAGGADHWVGLMVLFAGQTQQLPRRKASDHSAAEMMSAVSSDYRPDLAILNVAARKDVSYEQRIHHDGFEIYSSSAGFLVSAGGIQTGIANRALLGPFEFDPGLSRFDADRGVAMPTVLIPNAGARQMSVTEFLRIEGPRVFYPHVDNNIPGITTWTFDHNTCVRRGFACGINLVVPANLAGCLSGMANAPSQWSFLNSATCPAFTGAPPFFVAIYRQDCIAPASECLFTGNSGFFEAVDRPTVSFEQFKKQTIQNNPQSLTAGLRDSSSLVGTYVSTRSGRIEFDVKGHEHDDDTYGIRSVNGNKEGDADDWELASGDVIKADGGGRLEIRDPGSSRWIEMDFTDADHPKRVVH